MDEKAKMARLKGLSKKLNEASGELDEHIMGIELKIRDMQSGISAWVPFGDKRRLGFAFGDDSTWGFLVGDEETGDKTYLTSSNRLVKVEAVPLLWQVVDALLEITREHLRVLQTIAGYLGERE